MQQNNQRDINISIGRIERKHSEHILHLTHKKSEKEEEEDLIRFEKFKKRLYVIHATCALPSMLVFVCVFVGICSICSRASC